MNWQRLISIKLIVFLLFNFTLLKAARRLPNIYWNSTSLIFADTKYRQNRISNVLRRDLYATNVVSENDYLEFVCPNSSEQLVVSMVSEMSFLACLLDSNSVQFLICDNKDYTYQKPKRKKIIFTEESINSNTINFLPGHSYYFISTSNGTSNGLYNTQSGFCVTKNMRLKVDFVYSNNPTTTKKTKIFSTQMEYFIEENEDLEKKIDETKIKTNSFGNVLTNPISLAEMFNIKPEYFEFVRTQAIKGGTGEIQFPNQDDSNLSKRPRFVLASTTKNQLISDSNTLKTTELDNEIPKVQTTNEFPLNFFNDVINYKNSVAKTNEFMSLNGNNAYVSFRKCAFTETFLQKIIFILHSAIIIFFFNHFYFN